MDKLIKMYFKIKKLYMTEKISFKHLKFFKMEKKIFNSPLFSTVENISGHGTFLGSCPIKNQKKIRPR